MKQSDTLYILTENVYGSYSPFVKCAIDRSLSYVQPYFTIRNHEMHHVLTSPTHLQLIVIAYGSENEQEKECQSSCPNVFPFHKKNLPDAAANRINTEADWFNI